jgi:hypothetical protein
VRSVEEVLRGVLRSVEECAYGMRDDEEVKR